LRFVGFFDSFHNLPLEANATSLVSDEHAAAHCAILLERILQLGDNGRGEGDELYYCQRGSVDIFASIFII